MNTDTNNDTEMDETRHLEPIDDDDATQTTPSPSPATNPDDVITEQSHDSRSQIDSTREMEIGASINVIAHSQDTRDSTVTEWNETEQQMTSDEDSRTEPRTPGHIPTAELTADLTDEQSRLHDDRPKPIVEHNTSRIDNSAHISNDEQGLNAILAYLKQIDNKLIETKAEIKNEINLRINENSTKLSYEIQECRQMLENQVHEIREEQKELRNELKQIKEIQGSQSAEIEVINIKFDSKISQIRNETKTYVDENLIKQREAIEEVIYEENNQLKVELESKIEKSENKIAEEMKAQLKQNLVITENTTKAYIRSLHEELAPTVMENQKKITEQRDEIKIIAESLEKCELDVKSLRTSAINGNHLTGPIQVICSGSDTTDRHIPKFNGRSGNPNEYLQRLKRYYEKSIERQPCINRQELLRDILEISFEGPASRWLQLIKFDVRDWDSFATEFTSKYWSREVQRGIKNKIENEKYRPQGNLSRTEYFTERVLLLQSITPAMTEEEIVTLLAERFDTLIQDSVNVQNITTIKMFEKLLQKEDIREGPKRNKQNGHHNQENHPKPANQNGHQNNQNDNSINNRAYQPRWDHNRANNQQNAPRYENRRDQDNNRNSYRPHRDYKPYHKERYQPRQPDYNPPEQRRYPTREQEQVLAIVRQNDPMTLAEAMRYPPPPIQNNNSGQRENNGTIPPAPQENDRAL